MKQIVDKLNKIAKAIDENVELSDRDLIIDSLDSITKAFGGTPNESNLIVDKLEDIAGVASGGGGGLTVPLLTMNITNVGEAPALWGNCGLPIELAYIDNNYLYIESPSPDKPIPSHETVSVKLIYVRIVENEEVIYMCPAPDQLMTNLVNCTIQQGLFAPEIIITDPTQNASVDVEVTGTR